MASPFSVTVKWGKEKYDLELNPTESPLAFKCLIFSVTGVPPERQKVMGVKGGVLKDEGDWAALGVKPGHSFMLIGTVPENVPTGPQHKTVFVEDMVPDMLVPILQPSGFPPGLVNLGNTCYMNSAVQTLLSVDELKTAIKNYAGSSSAYSNLDNRGHVITNSLKALVGRLENSVHSLPPMEFVEALKNCFPQFDQKDDSGRPMQQDAEECWSSIVGCLNQSLSLSPSSNSDQGPSWITKLFSGEMAATITCAEAPEEPKKLERTNFLKMECHISNTTNHLIDGLKDGLTEKFERNSPSLGRMAQYLRVSSISHLPYVLTLQFVRFLWRKDTNKKAKIVRPVSFPLTLDLFDLCSDELKSKLKVKRDRIKKMEDEKLHKEREERVRKIAEERAKEKELENAKKGKKSPATTSATTTTTTSAATTTTTTTTSTTTTSTTTTPTTDTPTTVETEGKDKEKMEVETTDDLQNDTGMYELIGVVSHRGRYADSGHYVGWVKQENGGWLKFDDDQVTPVHEEEIKKLSGSEGADWHIAYLCVFRTKKFDL
eukprot:TRINITY_DN3943_c0_g1_i1.p1 TRINITY_DN3943_c0_g1~~TRINITY_DN3943_c0_g1_i1.p1  ORF type:complete len:545 (-),score=195.43 TRINITY_DN3943_c0_g1_i1:81-1715(-)